MRLRPSPKPSRSPSRRPRTDLRPAASESRCSKAPRSLCSAAVFALATALLGWPNLAHAETKPPPGKPRLPSPSVTTGAAAGADAAHHVRLALSPSADKRLAELRVRRLLAVELGRRIGLDREVTGPLDDALVQVWIDYEAERVRLQVRRMGKTLARRSLDVSRYPAELAAHMVAIEASEMIRVQVAAAPPDPCGSCRLPPPRPSSPLGGLRVASGATARWLPTGTPSLFVGSALEFGGELGLFRQFMRGEWLAAGDGSAPGRWLGATFGVESRLPWRTGEVSEARPGDRRLHLGLIGTLATVDLGGAAPKDDWTALVAGRASFELGVRRGIWLGVALEPGAVLRAADGGPSGFSLGAGLTIAAGPAR